jgi:transcriptional regulator with XRE-family HTH domain
MREVRRLRQAKEWNQAELAFHAGLAPSVISEIETGKRDPSAGTLRKLANALEVDVPDLFGRSEDLKAQAPLPFDEPAQYAAERRYLIPLVDSYTLIFKELVKGHKPLFASLSRDLPPSTSFAVFQRVKEFMYTCDLIEHALNEKGVMAAAVSLSERAEMGEKVPDDLLQKVYELQEVWVELFVEIWHSANDWLMSQRDRPEVQAFHDKAQRESNSRLEQARRAKAANEIGARDVTVIGDYQERKQKNTSSWESRATGAG